MNLMRNNKFMINIEEDNKWKSRSALYLKELQAFLDKADSIKDAELKNDIIIQMLKCDDELTKLSKQLFQEYYLKGKRENSIKK